MFIPFGEWAPDSPALIGAARTATNCIAENKYYKPFPSLGINTNALTSRACGAISFANRSGTSFTFAGDLTKLYQLSASTQTFNNVSKSGDYSALSDTRWEFGKFGDQVIATNYLNNVQSFNTASDSLFSDLEGNPPRARHIAVVNNFVILSNLVDATFGVASNAVRWCGINNPTTWTASASTQSDGQLLENGDGGAIQAIVGNSNYGIIIQERCIQRMNYIGSPAVFSFELLERNRGSSIPNSVVGVGRNVFYIDSDGFYYFNGAQSIPIGKDKVNKYFFDNFDSNYKSRLSASIDLVNTIVMWAFTTKNLATGNPNQIIAYNWISGRFTLIIVDVEILYQALTLGLTVDGPGSNVNIDSLPFSLDSDVYKGGQLFSGVFNTDHKAGFFSGSPMTAIVETTEFEGAKNAFTEINQITPMIEGNSSTDVTIRMGSRNNRTNLPTYSSSLSDDSFGRVKTRANARYHQIEATIAGGFDKATGIEVDDEFIKIGARR